MARLTLSYAFLRPGSLRKLVAGHLRPGSTSSRFPHNAGQHANFPLIKSSFDFQPLARASTFTKRPSPARYQAESGA